MAPRDLCMDTATCVQTQALAHWGTDPCTQLCRPAYAHTRVHTQTHAYTYTCMLTQTGHMLGLIDMPTHVKVCAHTDNVYTPVDSKAGTDS